MELIIGRAGEEHVSSADVASMLRGIYGDIDCVVPEGDSLSCTALNANTVEIGTGGCFIQGHYCRVELAEQLTIRSGSPGFKRNDLVVVRYELSTENTQSAVLAIVEGTPTTATVEDPSIAEGSIDGGDQKAEFALWRIPIDGVNVGTPERVLPLFDNYQTAITDLRETVTPKLLWTNPNPNQEFAAQTVMLSESLDDYEYFTVVWSHDSAQDAAGTSTFLVGTPGLMFFVAGAYGVHSGPMFMANRNILSSSGKSITFGAGGYIYGNNATDDNTRIIPLSIWGKHHP